MLRTANKTVRLIGGVLETFSLLSLKLAVKNPRGLRQFPGRAYRVYMSLVGKGHWRCQDVFQAFPHLQDKAAKLHLEFTRSSGLAWEIEDLVHLALIAAAIQPRTIFEIGTYRGRSALNFALNSPDDCVIHTLDLPSDDVKRSAAASATNAADARLIQGSITGIEFRGKPAARKIRQHYGDAANFDFGPFEQTCDLVFIDGAHHYNAAFQDTQSALRLVKPGGWILWDDWGNYGDYNDIVRAVLAILPGNEIMQFAGTQLAIYRAPDA